MPKNMSSEAPFAAAKARLRKKRIGSIGVRVRSSQRTNTATRAEPSASEPATSRLPQPWPLPRTRPQTSPRRPVEASARPGRSSGARVP